MSTCRRLPYCRSLPLPTNRSCSACPIPSPRVARAQPQPWLPRGGSRCRWSTTQARFLAFCACAARAGGTAHQSQERLAPAWGQALPRRARTTRQREFQTSRRPRAGTYRQACFRASASRSRAPTRSWAQRVRSYPPSAYLRRSTPTPPQLPPFLVADYSSLPSAHWFRLSSHRLSSSCQSRQPHPCNPFCRASPALASSFRFSSSSSRLGSARC
mmetsp:Transcript_14461/g.38358  ORF Transcript_14461/g.38358 Transcript_14461/m.38358 type:complete len:215 (-) Transcript_14461:324-968(-)